MLSAVLVVVGCALAALGLAWLYFRRYAIKRAPIGVINLADVVYMMAAIILLPLLYLLLPRWAVAAVLAVESGGLVYLVWEPILRRRLLVGLVAAGAVGSDLGAALLAGSGSPLFYAANDLLMVVIVVGIANLLAQSGLKARDAALLAAFLIGYDFLATARLPLMGNLVQQVAGLPFSPMFAWPVPVPVPAPAGQDGAWVGLGLGDVVLATVFPLVMRKAFGRSAGLGALAIGIAAFVVLFLLPLVTQATQATLFPAMVALGPLMVAQYLYWRRRIGPERTTRQYQQAEPVRIS